MTDNAGQSAQTEHASARPEQMMRDKAYDRIETLLNSGELKPGQLVSQRELVTLTGTTLGSVREAIARFQTEGLLVALPKRGLMVPSMDVQFVREAYELRKVLELAAVEAAMQYLPQDLIADWIREFETARDVAPGQDQRQADEIQRLDWEMHNALIGAMQNQLALNVYRVNSIKIRMAVQYRLRVTPFNAERIGREHLAFLVPMRDGHIENAKRALERHIENSLTLALGGTVPSDTE
ncbi:GntR family transcriptional regulator [uncultured Martelella sp.]|uniref:GntR family transcriptional regulator n=1 Tax=uncultured Martelella sp. TaxID=392331 RepID=UPI0029C84233|nr:GntR family transcriptional regulator [uncultured Martelella sp.]